MRREPYVPGSLAETLPEPLPRALREPAVLFDEASLIAACRRTEALFNRVALALLAGLCLSALLLA